MFFKQSQEGKEKGLDVMNGEVVLLPNDMKIPHMGWNEVDFVENPLFLGLEQKTNFYFVHSYYFKTSNDGDTIATTNYPNRITAAVNKENIFGTQFHPEKSHDNGQIIIKNFLEWMNK